MTVGGGCALSPPAHSMIKLLPPLPDLGAADSVYCSRPPACLPGSPRPGRRCGDDGRACWPEGGGGCARTAILTASTPPTTAGRRPANRQHMSSPDDT